MKSLQKSINESGIRSLIVYKKERELMIRIRKTPVDGRYPKVIMPEQPACYIKTKKHECW